MLKDMKKEDIIKALCEDIAQITKASVDVITSLESIKGKDLNMVSDFISQMKFANMKAKEEIDKLARDNKEPN